MELESKFDNPLVYDVLRQKVQVQQHSIEVLCHLTNEGVIEYEKIFRDVEVQGSRLFHLEQKIASCKQN
jgi:hypothetical protein